MVSVDTTFLADLIRKNPEANKKLRELVKEGDRISTTVVNCAELFYGAYKSTKVDKEKEKMRFVLSHLLIFEMDQASAEKFGEIKTELEGKGQKIDDRDIMIGAIAISKGERAIVTRNKKDFESITAFQVQTY